MAINNNDPANSELGGVHGREATPEEVAKRDGYMQGRTDENYVQRDLRNQERAVDQARANDSAASGMVLGLFLALLALGAGAAIYFLTGDRTTVAPVAVPQIQKETIKEKETTTIIEKETPAPAVSLPDVNIEVPEVKVPDINVTKEAPAEPEAATPAPVTEPVPEPAAEPAQ